MHTTTEQDFQQLKMHIDPLMYETDERNIDINIATDHENWFQLVASQVYDQALTILLQQYYNLMFFVLGLVILMIFFLTPVPYTFWMAGTFLLGTQVIFLVAYISLRFSFTGANKMIVETRKGKEEGFSFGYLVGFFISVSCIMVVLICNFVIFAVYKKYFLNDEYTPEKYHSLGLLMVGYGFGIVFGSIFFRETSSEFGRGINMGFELKGTSSHKKDNDYDEETPANLQMCHIIGNIFSQSVTNVIDTINIIAVLITIYVIIVSQSTLITEKAWSVYYLPTMLLMLSSLIAIAVSILAGTGFEKLDPATYTAWQVQLQLIYSFCGSMIANFLAPLLCLPLAFDNGKPDDDLQKLWARSSITYWGTFWCLEIGLFVQMVLIWYADYYTSHSRKNVRELITQADQSFAHGSIFVNMYTHISINVAVFALGFLAFFCWYLAGFFGVIIGALGMMSSAATILTISYLGNTCTDAYQMSALGRVPGRQKERIFAMAWASQTYSVFIQIINAGSAFFVSLAGIGCLIIISKPSSMEIWDPRFLFGFLFGGALAYYLKGSSSYASSLIAQEMIKDSDKENEGIMDKIADDDRYRVLQRFLNTSYKTVLQSIIFDIFTIFILIALISLLLGAQGAIGIFIGLSLIGTQLILLSLTRGNAWKNASAFREHNRKHEKENRNANSSLQGYVASLIIDSIPGTPVFTYILMATMYILVISTVIPFDADLGKDHNVWESIKAFFSGWFWAPKDGQLG